MSGHKILNKFVLMENLLTDLARRVSGDQSLVAWHDDDEDEYRLYRRDAELNKTPLANLGPHSDGERRLSERLRAALAAAGTRPAWCGG